jgi:hypothetical protein
MALDIKEGDVLVVSSVEYPIRAAGDWDFRWGVTTGFTRMATKTASTKRPPALSAGKRGVAATNLTGLTCTPLDPVAPEVRQRLALNTPHELLETFVSDGSEYKHLILEDLKR